MKRIVFTATFLLTSLLSFSQGVTEISIPYNGADSTLNADALARYNEGITAFENGKLDEAVSKFTEAITIEPLYGKAYFNRGTVYAQQKKKEEAIADFEKSAGLLKEHPDNAWFQIGMVRSENGEYTPAIEAYSKAIEINKEVAKYYYYRGVCYFQKEDFE